MTHKPYPWELESPSPINTTTTTTPSSMMLTVTKGGLGKGSTTTTSNNNNNNMMITGGGGWIPQFVVKLEEGFSGKGNALLSLKNLPSIPRTEQGWKQISKENKQQFQRLILQQFSTMKFQVRKGKFKEK